MYVVKIIKVTLVFCGIGSVDNEICTSSACYRVKNGLIVQPPTINIIALPIYFIDY